MKSLYITLFVICFSIIVNAQGRYNVDRVGLPSTFNITPYGITESDFLSATGSPYLNSDFEYGSIKTENQVVKSYMRYNIFFDEIEVANTERPDTKDISGLSKKNGITATFNGRTYMYYIVDSSKGQGTYLQIIKKGSSFDLFAKTKVRYIPPFYSKNGITSDKPGRFDQSNDYFLVSKDFRFAPIPPKKKDFLSMLGIHKESVKGFIKKERLKLNNENDLIKLVNFYNKLQNGS